MKNCQLYFILRMVICCAVLTYQKPNGLSSLVSRSDSHLVAGRSPHGCLAACLAPDRPVQSWLGGRSMPSTSCMIKPFYLTCYKSLFRRRTCTKLEERNVCRIIVSNNGKVAHALDDNIVHSEHHYKIPTQKVVFVDKSL